MGLPRHLEIPQFVEIPRSREGGGGTAYTLSWMGSNGLDFLGAIHGRTDLAPAKRLSLMVSVHSRDGDVKAEIGKKDNTFTRLRHGERIRLVFPAPEQQYTFERDLILVTHGYYRR
jgi:hypothetical protein